MDVTTEPREEGTKPWMSFWDHLEELRWRIVKSIGTVILGGIVSLAFSDFVLKLALIPVTMPGSQVELVNFTPLSMVMVRLYIALVTGIFVGLPVLIYQAWRFLSPGLLPHERRAIPWVILSSMLLFMLGVGLALVFMPFLLTVLVEAGYEGIRNTWNIRAYIGFLLGFTTSFGIVFQLPIIIYLLSLIGLVTPAKLRRYRRYAIVLIFIVAAVLTPTPDPFSQLAMAIPLLLLFEASIHVSTLVWKAKNRRKREDEVGE